MRTRNNFGAARLHGRKSLVCALTSVFLAGGALSSPVLAQESCLTAVMHSGLRQLDPVMTTAGITRDHAYMIYDVLIALDENLEPQPQMADWTVSGDNLVYTFTLRDGLMFHNGEPVKAADAVASLKRWGQRDAGGQMVFDLTETLEATDDKTITWTLTQPLPPFLEIIAKPSAIAPFILPASIASTPASEAISSHIGSGPFTFVEEKYRPGLTATYQKFDDYKPREEPTSWFAGAKVVKVDCVEWLTMPDAQTAINALVAGEIDYVEQPSIDLLPILKASPDITVETRSDFGNQPIGRMNFKHPPFNDLQVRQAAMMAVSQENVLAAMIGNPDYYSVCGAIFGCGTPLEDRTGSRTLTSGGDVEAAKELLKNSSYDGTPVVVLQPTDVVMQRAQPTVVAQALREAGFEVELQPMDWQTLGTRRASMKPPAEGGWNMMFTYWELPEIMTPLVNVMVNGRGDDAWFGWPDEPELVKLQEQFAAAETPDQQKKVASLIQAYVLENVIYIPLGQYVSPQARRNTISGMIPAPIPVFWNVEKSDTN